jgi:hypothetical protein
VRRLRAWCYRKPSLQFAASLATPFALPRRRRLFFLHVFRYVVRSRIVARRALKRVRLRPVCTLK